MSRRAAGTGGGPRAARAGTALAMLALCAGLAHGQLADRVSVRAAAEALIPVFGDQAFFTTGGGGSLTAEFAALPWLRPLVSVGLSADGIRGGDILTLAQAGIGAAAVASPLERLALRVEALAGLYAAYRGDLGASNFCASASGEVAFRVSPSVSLAARAGLGTWLGPAQPLLRAATAGLSATVHVGGLALGGGRVRVENVRMGSVYPVFYSYYDDHPFGSLSLVNAEAGEIRDVRVSLSIGRYMDQPKQCASFPVVARGGRVEVPLYALFTDEVLSLTEPTRAPGEVIVDYSIMGTRRQARAPLVQRFFHRNAMNWDDDRKAAAFVSARDPAAQWFAKYVSGIVRGRSRAGISPTLQLAMGLFETERLFGLSYVVDPSSSYVAMSADESAVDSLQYPHQTLFYRGGDCDDMSILFAALLESVGVHTAFITVPGHIFMAFDLGMSEADARQAFFDPGLLIFRSGQAWVPVEITMVKEGFVKAWRVGAREWTDASAAGTAAFYPMEESWKAYPAVGPPGVNPRFSLPDEALVIQAFDDAVNRYVAREIDPAVRAYKARLAADTSPETANELGILLGSSGLLREAWAQFTACAEAPRVYGWTNLASVAFLRGDYGLAVSYYEWALQQDPGNPVALLGIARSSYEVERFDRAAAAYARLVEADPGLAASYGYLASSMGGTGRAWSFADRLSTTVWDGPARVAAALPAAPRAEEPQPVAVAQPAPAPQPAAAPEPAPALEPAPAPQAATEVASLPAQSLLPRRMGMGSTWEAGDPGIPRVAAAPAPASQPQPLPKVAVAPAQVEPAPPQKAPTPKTPPAQAPPKISKELPVDKDIVAAAAVRVVTVQAAPKLPEPAPAPKPPEPAPAPQPPAPEPVVVAAAPPAAVPPAQVEPAPQPAPQPEPRVEPEPELQPQGRVVLEGFDGAVRYAGRWTVQHSTARQADEKALAAKLAVPLAQGDQPLACTVTARSQGTGWVGVGLHVLVRGAEKHRGWGEGSSVLAWLTSDPKHRGDTLTRLQLYRSTSDIDMKLVDECVVPESVFDANEISVRVDPSGGSVSVWLNGTERLTAGALADLGPGVSVVFRCIDRAEFQDFRVEEMP